MAKAEVHEILPVDKDKLFSVVTRYEDYPQFVDGVKSVKVERKGPGQARVTYHVAIMKDISYTLDHTEDAATGQVRWRLVESEYLKSNNGFWDLKSAGAGKTDVRYGVELEFKFPVPGFILSQLIKKNLNTMIRNFEGQTRSASG